MKATVFLLGALFLTVSALASGDTLLSQSGPQRVSMLEIFSSEGCSSCPPAEEWASGLVGSPGLWKNFVPAVFHVDYWDYLGWKDPLSDARFSDRQRAYADSWPNGRVYTPGFILNGREWGGWYAGGFLGGANSQETGVLSIEKAGEDRYRIIFETHEKGKSYTAHAALLGFGLVSDVKSGENAGRKLKHDFAVMDFSEGEMTPSGDGRFEKTFALKTSGDPRSKKWAVAAWVSAENKLEPLQATGAYL